MFLLDTNVLSELRQRRNRKPDPNVVAWARRVAPEDLFLSAICILELEMGVLQKQRTDPTQGAVLRSWLEEHVLTSFAGRILPVDIAVAQRCAALHVHDPCSYRDSLIAATALIHGMTVVTRNVLHFTRTGVKILNPWQG